MATATFGCADATFTTPKTGTCEMGMDVFGKNPKSKEGEYFRNNVWWWRPLAIYCYEVAPDIAARCKYWGSNDGDGLGKEDSIRLAELLQAEIDSGRCRQYANKPRGGLGGTA